MEKYRQDVIPPAAGLLNINQRCWFNTLMQGLLTSSQFIEAVRNYSGKSNAVLATLATFIEDYRNTTNGMIPAADSIYLKLTGELDAMSQGGIMAGRQNCLGEALTKLLDKINCREINDLFAIKYSRKVHCDACGHDTEPTGELDNFIRLQSAELFEHGAVDAAGIFSPTMRQRRFENWLRGNQIEVPDYKCEKCSFAGKCMRRSTLTLVSDVMFFVCDTKGMRYWYPLSYDVARRTPDNATVNMTYALTAVFHHNGGTSGGHWNCDCLRKPSADSTDVKFVHIDDMSISATTRDQISASPTILMYCYQGDNVEPATETSLWLTPEESAKLPVPTVITPATPSVRVNYADNPALGYSARFSHLSSASTVNYNDRFPTDDQSFYFDSLM